MFPELNKNKNTHHSTISTDRSSEAKQTLYLLLCIYRPTHNSAVLVLSIAATYSISLLMKNTLVVILYIERNRVGLIGRIEERYNALLRGLHEQSKIIASYFKYFIFFLIVFIWKSMGLGLGKSRRVKRANYSVVLLYLGYEISNAFFENICIFWIINEFLNAFYSTSKVCVYYRCLFVNHHNLLRISFHCSNASLKYLCV